MSKREYVYKGIIGLPAIARRMGATTSKLQYCIQSKGMTFEQAEKVIKEHHDIINETTYKGAVGLEAISKKTGISFTKLKIRMIKHGMSIERAVQIGDLCESYFEQKQKKPKVAKVKRNRYKPVFDNITSLALGLITRSEYDERTKSAV